MNVTRVLFRPRLVWCAVLAAALREPGDGARGLSDHFPKVDAASQEARLVYWTRALAELDSIPCGDLSPEERVNARVFRTSVQALANHARYKTYEAPFNADTFFRTDFTPRQGLQTVDEYRRYLSRLRDAPRYFEEQIADGGKNPTAPNPVGSV